jgi:DNA-binding transcriptional LysR family regulator
MKLQYFRNAGAIAEQGSLRAAPRHLSIAQPTLTHNLSELERNSAQRCSSADQGA